MNEKKLPSHAKVVIIGGGVVGCSILFHLAKFGWKDVVLLERDELTSGSSWHAAGQIHTISSDPNISRLQGYTINLYKEIEETSGQSVGMHSTGGFYLAAGPNAKGKLNYEQLGAHLQLGQVIAKRFQPAIRYAIVNPDGDDNDAHDIDVAFSVYFFGHKMKWQTEFNTTVMPAAGDVTTALGARTSATLAF